MSITLNSWGPKIQADPAPDGYCASFFADTKAEIATEDGDVLTANVGSVNCVAGASCVTAAGELLFMNSSGVWAEVV